ncbi:MAG: hypothetical protein ACQKBY_02285, partial [Verrucomicrobiales bacterium]
IAKDPHEIRNLAGEKAYAGVLADLRERLDERMKEVRDVGLLPEALYGEKAGKATLRDYALSENNPLEEVMALAEKAISREASFLGDLRAAMASEDELLRYWGVKGVLIRGGDARELAGELEALLGDKSDAVRILAAQSLIEMGLPLGEERVLAVLKQAVRSRQEAVNTMALQVLEKWPKGYFALRDEVVAWAGEKQGGRETRDLAKEMLAKEKSGRIKMPHD